MIDIIAIVLLNLLISSLAILLCFKLLEEIEKKVFINIEPIQHIIVGLISYAAIASTFHMIGMLL